MSPTDFRVLDGYNSRTIASIGKWIKNSRVLKLQIICNHTSQGLHLLFIQQTVQSTVSSNIVGGERKHSSERKKTMSLSLRSLKFGWGDMRGKLVP